ncbi:MAG: hypothetical protein IT381_06060 [Deltaproteobacteria bacterium]|nr:hypothetical protein [Deltaproteobacteria bacterium]
MSTKFSTLVLFSLLACKPAVNGASIVGVEGVSGQPDAPTPAPAVVSNLTVLSGTAFLIAPVKGAHVKATRLTNAAEVVGEATTGGDGEWTIEFSADGDVLIEVLGDRGGGCIEPVTGVTPIALSQDDRLLTVAAHVGLGEKRGGITVNPWTTLIGVRTLAAVRAGTELATAWQHNTELFSAHFGSIAPWDSSAVDLAREPAAGLSSSAIYSFTVFALSQHALELGRRAGVTDVSVINSFTTLRLLMRDLDDLVFDGAEKGSPLPALAGNVRLDAETTRASLARSLEDFLASENNKSGFGARDLAKVLAAIRADKSELYPTGEPDIDRDPTEELGSPPAITIVAPTEMQIIGQGTKLTAEIVDVDGISEASVLIDGMQTGIVFDSSNPTTWRTDVAMSVDDGAHVLEVNATDAKGNTSTKTLNFTYDHSPPAVAYLACHAPNDLLRTVTTSAGGATFDPITQLEACVEASLDSGDQQFHTFADLLASEGTDTPAVNISVTDSSELASVTCQLLINGAASGSSLPCPTGDAPATHSLAVNAAVFGDSLLGLNAADQVALQVTAIDALGNTTVRTFAFRLHVLATPLHVTTLPLTPQYALVSYSFAADNIDKLFVGTNFPDYLVQLNAYQVTNVSARPVKLSLVEGFENDGAWWTRRTLMSPFQLYTGFTVTDGAGVCSNGQALKFLRWGSTPYHQCVTPASLTRLESMQTGYIPGFNFDIQRQVFTATGTKLVPDDNNDVELAPGQSYRVQIGTRYPFFTAGSTSPRCEAVYYPEWITHAVRSAPQNVGGFYKKHLFITNYQAGGTYSFYGYLSCDSNMRYSCPSSGLCGFDAFVSNGAVYPVSYAVIERDLRFQTAATWMPRIRLATSTTSIPARADRTGFAILQDYRTENTRPPDGLGFSLAGW